jgi:NADPH-dependent curcumin reductase CurA
VSLSRARKAIQPTKKRANSAVGNVVVQYAKKVLKANKVIAIVGSEEKCQWIKKLGADVALNYKSATFAQDLVNATSDFVDAYFDRWALRSFHIVLVCSSPFCVQCGVS